MQLFRKLVFPFVPIYWLLTWARNFLYDTGLKRSTSFNFPIICVGNLNVGGTGKTPMVEYLISLLKDRHRIATLSRGYKRKTKGFQLANENSVVEDLGDEPFQFYSKFGKSIDVAVDNNRVNGVTKLKTLQIAPKIILLDDAYQHRKIKAGFNILLTTYSSPFFKDMLLPTGDLREPRMGYKRANVIVVTKCPGDINEAQKAKYIKWIKPTPKQSVFFSSISYSKTVISSQAALNLDELKKFTLVTGIANPNSLVKYLKTQGKTFEHLNFPDHYEFSIDDINILQSKSLILTTEKDYMRLKMHKTLENKLFYLPIEVIISEKERFNKLIFDFVDAY